MHVSILILIMLSGMPENRRTPQNTAGRDGVLCGMRIAECRNLKGVFCGISPAERSTNYTIIFVMLCVLALKDDDKAAASTSQNELGWLQNDSFATATRTDNARYSFLLFASTNSVNCTKLFLTGNQILCITLFLQYSTIFPRKSFDLVGGCHVITCDYDVNRTLLSFCFLLFCVKINFVLLVHSLSLVFVWLSIRNVLEI